MARAASVKSPGFAASGRGGGGFPDNHLPPLRPLRVVRLQRTDSGWMRTALGGGAGAGRPSSDTLALSILRALEYVPFERGTGATWELW